MLDNIIDVNKFPNKIYENYQKNFRTIGLGFTGLADALVMLNYKYNTKEARYFVNELVELIAASTYLASIELAKERGAFPFLLSEQYVISEYISKHVRNGKFKDVWKVITDGILAHGIRNAKLLSVAPTGTLSLTFGNNCSSGLEPIFSLEYDRKVKIGGQTDDKIQIVKMRDYAYNEWLKIKDNPSTIVTKDKFITALEMSVNDHVDMLGVISQHIDMSCSKTINVPENYSFEDTKDIYMKCHDLGIKGCTIFRPNSIRQGILISNASDNSDINKSDKPSNSKEPVEACDNIPRGAIIKADDNCIGKKRTLTTGCGTLHCEAFFDPDNGNLLETYLSKGSEGGCNQYMIGLSRMISLSARGGISLEDIVDQLKSSGTCPSYAVRTAKKHDTSKGSSCPVAVGNALIEMHKEILSEIYDDDFDDSNSNLIKSNKLSNKSNINKFEKLDPNSNNKSNTISEATNTAKCPECGGLLVFEGGCNTCKDCGWSKCG